MRLLQNSYFGKITLALILILIFSCSTAKHEKAIELVQKKENCSTDSSLAYQLYIPSHTANCKNLPLLIIIDPHGAAQSAIQRFTAISEKYKVAIICSENIYNQLPDFLPRLNKIMTDVTTKYTLNDEVFVAGFSGGARMAFAFAQKHKLSGIIAAGALTTDYEIQKSNCSIYALAGMEDFNFGESARYVLQPQLCADNFYLEITGEMHEWPSILALERAFGCIFLKNKSNKNDCIPRKELTTKYFAGMNTYIDSLSAHKNYYQLQLIYHNLERIDLNNTQKKYNHLYNQLQANNDYQAQLKALQKSLEFEYRLREAYQQAIMGKDLIWWTNEIQVLQHQIASDNNTFQHFAMIRLKGFLGIICYSVTRNSLNERNGPKTKKILGIYRLLEPKNPDMFFYSALYEQQNNSDENKIVNLLQLALDNGYTDRKKLQNNFPEKILHRLKWLE